MDIAPPTPNPKSARHLFWAGYRAAMPMMIGVAPFGVVFGALAIDAGMSAIQALGMSIFVIAGLSQFVAAGLIQQDTPAAIIIFTTFVINLRHFLYSASLAAFLRPLSLGWKAMLGYIMIDEVYAPTMLRKTQGDLTPQELRWYFLGAGINLITIWWATTILGTWLGAVIPDSATEILGFTLPLIFTSIVVPTLTSSPKLAAAVVAGIVAILLAPLPNNLGLIIAALMGILTGTALESRSATTQTKPL